jgi:hypothetical protein
LPYQSSKQKTANAFAWRLRLKERKLDHAKARSKQKPNKDSRFHHTGVWLIYIAGRRLLKPPCRLIPVIILSKRERHARERFAQDCVAHHFSKHLPNPAHTFHTTPAKAPRFSGWSVVAFREERLRGREKSMSGAATRYVASFIVEFFSDFICFAVQQNNLTPEEIAIICLVASESTRAIRKDPFAMRSFGTEDFAFPDTERPAVSIKVIHTRLGLSRETTRRKVAHLVERGFLRKAKGGVILPAQVGEDDYTKELRNFLIRKVEVLNSYRDKMMD